MFTDTEVGLAIAHGRQMRGVVSDANAIIAGKDAAIDEAHDEIRRLHAELATERARRQAAESQVAKLKSLVRSLA